MAMQLVVSALIILSITNVGSQSSDKSWLIHPKNRKSSRSVVLDDESPDGLFSASVHIESTIRMRYARTLVTSRMANRGIETQENSFILTLPDTAFMAGFVMEVDGVPYPGEIKEHHQALADYQTAVQQGQGAALVATNPGTTNELLVRVNITPKSALNFQLNYGELLTRRRGLYESGIGITPGPIVPNMTARVRVNEALPILNLRVPRMRQNQEQVNDLAQVEHVRDNEAIVKFTPTGEQQMNTSSKDVQKKFVVQYDVDRSSVEQDGGEIYVNGGYFVHFFSPSSLPTLPKHVTFVLDTSGTMKGTKIGQIALAMESMFDQLHPQDYFSVVEFSSDVQEWNLTPKTEGPKMADASGPFGRLDATRAYPATNESIARAKIFIRSMTAHGGRNLNDAMMTALNISHSVRYMDNNLTSIVILVTDGAPSAGVTDADAIASNIRSANSGGHVSIFSFGLGQDADVDLLKKISSQNGGFALGIDDVSDASVQLSHFFEEVSSPVLTDVRFRYEGVDVNSLVERRLGHLFNGSEMVVAGRVQGPLRAVVEGSGIEAKIYKPRIARQWATIENLPVEQSVAFMQVTNLLSQAPDNSSIQDQALNLALANQLVTPITSAVAVISQPSGSTPKRSGRTLGDEHKNIRTTSRNFIPIASYLKSSIQTNFHEYLEPYQHNATHVTLPISGKNVTLMWNFDSSLSKDNTCSAKLSRKPEINTSKEGTCQPISNCIWIGSVSPTIDDFCVVEERFIGICCNFSRES